MPWSADQFTEFTDWRQVTLDAREMQWRLVPVILLLRIQSSVDQQPHQLTVTYIASHTQCMITSAIFHNSVLVLLRPPNFHRHRGG